MDDRDVSGFAEFGNGLFKSAWLAFVRLSLEFKLGDAFKWAAWRITHSALCVRI